VLLKYDLLARGRAPAELPAAIERREQLDTGELCALLTRVERLPVAVLG
jgi:hypothetical protein